MNHGVFFFTLKVSRSGVEVMFLVFIKVSFCTTEGLYSFSLFTAKVVNIRDIIVLHVDQAFALVDFVASDYFNFGHFLELWRT